MGISKEFEKSLLEKGYIKHGDFYERPRKSNLLADNVVPPKQVVHHTPIVTGSTIIASHAQPLIVFEVDPIGAPRMTKSDQWKSDPDHNDPKKRQRKPVTQYFRFKDAVRAQAAKLNFTLPESFHAVCVIPMPHSWSNKKKGQMDGARHQNKPDADNILKGVQDSLMDSDAKVWDVRITKYWGRSGKIIIYKL